ncbi:potassium channel subfamily K-like protein [Euroglyphus maynei]|uniref:Potassium channel subfamily K-like protein n=1 Tax=Euroglyphus maynei TaxID=6958 RepID=A0A1Y3B722_EURMA|nr:potassium channel subfamily K-like protein [Euroglyphus maynei]
MANIQSPMPRAPPRFHRSGIGHHTPLSSSRFGGGNRTTQSMFVIDPKTLATRLLVKPNYLDDVLVDTNTRLVRIFVWLKRVSKNWFTHLFLLIALILYALIGGMIFSTIEGNHEMEQNVSYGDNPPVTTMGKTAAMIYSFFGIPLLLIVLADFGPIFTKIIKYSIMSCRRIYYDRSLRSVRHMGRKATRTAKIQQAIMDAVNKIQRKPPFFIDPKTGHVTMLPPPKISQPNLQSTTNPMMASHRPTNQIPIVTISSPTPSSTMMTPETPMPTMLDFNELDEEFNLPISLALAILLLYLFFGAILFWAFEKWTLFQAFYFVFISMSTIGFGDFIPTQYNVLLYAFIYFLFGLALTSMCINVIQEKLSSTFEKARITIGESIGLDPSTPITIVNPNPTSSSQQQQQQHDASSSKSNSAEKSINK